MASTCKEQAKKQQHFQFQHSFQRAFENFSFSASPFKRRTSTPTSTDTTNTKGAPPLQLLVSHSLPTAGHLHPRPLPEKREILSTNYTYDLEMAHPCLSNTFDDLSLHPRTPSLLSVDSDHGSDYMELQPWQLDYFIKHKLGENESRNIKKASALVHKEKRDRYGFKQPTQWIDSKHFDQFDDYYQSVRERQEKKWKEFLSSQSTEWPIFNPQLKHRVRKGIPDAIRGRAWMHYSGAKAKMENSPLLYSSLLKTAISMGEHNEYAEIIRRDLHRTFPDNYQFTCDVSCMEGSTVMMPESNPTLIALERVLLAFSVYSPQVGYCQSLNYIVGFFLLFLDTEEEAFWMLVVTIHEYFPENMYDATMEGANIDQTVLLMMLYERLPAVWYKIANGKSFWECEQTNCLPSVTLVTSHWFLTLFINILPVETVLRIWDCFFIEGYKVLFRVALTLFKLNENSIQALEDPNDIFHILQNMPRRLIDCHRFMECVFVHSGISANLSVKEIERKRALAREHRQKRHTMAYRGKYNVHTSS